MINHHKTKKLPPSKYLRKILYYKNGKLYWKVSRRNIKKDRLAGHIRKDGYLVVRIDEKLYLGHRIIWALKYGDYPENKFIDHIDRNPLNNSIKNLRLVDYYVNTLNRKIYSTNTSGVPGVVFVKRTNKWAARIVIDYKNMFLGYFDKKEDATKARKYAEIKYKREWQKV